MDACNRVHPGKIHGPWKVLCDNESFLRAAPSMAAYRRKNMQHIKLPATSPDVNPVEKMWGWAWKKLRKRGLADLSAGRRLLGKSAYRQRVRSLLNNPAAQEVASQFFSASTKLPLRSLRPRVQLSRGEKCILCLVTVHGAFFEFEACLSLCCLMPLFFKR